MAQLIGRNRNTNDTAIISDAISLSNSTSTKIADVNPSRTYFRADIDSANHNVWLKLQAANVDNDKKGIFLVKVNQGRPYWEMPVDNIYTGEICAIAASDSPKIYVTEY